MAASSAISRFDGYLPAAQVLSMLESDFQSAWDALAAVPEQPGAEGRGNFVFAQLAVLALEFTCRVAAADSSDYSFTRFSRHLRDMDARYFMRLPGPVVSPKSFDLPSLPNVPKDESLIALLFDLVRNGQAHQFHQIPARLADGRLLHVAVGGAAHGQRYEAASPARRKEHLSWRTLPRTGNLRLVVLPDVLFRDIRHSARWVFSHGVEPRWFTRDYPFSSEALAAVLSRAEPDRA